MEKFRILSAMAGVALPVAALYAYAGSSLDDENVAAIPLVAVSALFAVEIFQGADKRRGEGKIFAASFALTCAVIGLVRTLS